MYRLTRGWHDNRFLAEAVYDLRNRLKAQSSNLLIRFGKTEVVATNVVKSLQAGGDDVRVFLQREVSDRFCFYFQNSYRERVNAVVDSPDHCDVIVYT